MTIKTIDITPTWVGILPVLLELLEHSKTRQTAIDELHKMAKAADDYIEHLKGAKQND